MSESIALIVGGSGAAGQSAIEAFQDFGKESGKKWKIIATTSGEGEVAGADETIHSVKLEDPKLAIENIQKALKTKGPIDVLIYTPARGNLGYPVSETPDEDIVATAKFCLDPMLELEKALSPRITVGYSAYYYLPHLLTFYGSLAFIKKKMEEWALQRPDSRKIIRAGTFFSQSVRGITLILQRLAKTSTNADLQKLMEEQKASGKKFGDFFIDYIQDRENSSFKKNFPNVPYRITEPKDLKNALLKILKGEKAPIVSLVGDWVWTENTLPEMPDYLKAR
ncbi:SDR family NAD(P)-dependent oxidoreductase [Leptospira langatensis]|uniref:SDR family NAD(P)-dependent oxidoreductase n=1 Tax=Leptospira langatensis TaxID=2484983 RepID=A0A5F1ZWE7_9LEPT|nr:SDR family oxidoreductase [Leptospira langatensis]TGJ98268.1 SDR family NAD(P)-dependent oxidoreductase [Leptospira langatensis]TGL43182.1 SDR family NAD(P)-dependent oxidoreductase [Leptospira langatensis]